MSQNDLTEEALLGPVDGNRVEKMDREVETELEQTQDTQVSLSKKVDRLMKLAHRYVCAIGIVCESVLSKTFRSSDPVRNEVTQLAWEGIKNAIEQAYKEIVQSHVRAKPQDVEESVFEILRVAELTRTAQLEHYLDDTVTLRTKIGTTVRFTITRPIATKNIKAVLPSTCHWRPAKARLLRSSTSSDVSIQRSMTPEERRRKFELRQQAASLTEAKVILSGCAPKEAQAHLRPSCQQTQNLEGNIM